MTRMKDKTCLVTGAASGIGRAVADRFAKEGALVWLSDRDLERGRAAAAELTDMGLQARFIHHDVTSRSEWEAVMEAMRAQATPPDVIVNNAGIVIPGSIESTDWSQWRKTLDVNLDGVFHGTQLGVREMKTRGGAIINIASIEGIIGEPMALAYNASKGAVRLLTKSSALYCARSGIPVRINTVCPGYVETALVRDALSTQPPEVAQQFIAQTLANTPMGRLARPEEIAGAVLYLASDDAAFVTGTDLVVDGGFTA